MLLFFRAGFWLAVAATLYLTLRPLVAMTNVSDKTQHLAAFGTLTMLAALAYPRTRLWVVGVALSSLGALIELVQPITGRSNEAGDWLADTLGVLIGLTLVWVGRTLTQDKTSPR